MKLSNRQLVLLAALCIVLLGVVILALYKEYDRPWKIYQQRFRQLTSGKSVQSNPEGIRQIWNEKLGAVDRCMTCHEGIDDPLFTNAGQPFKTHSGNYLKYHPVEKFGCVICHDGQGPALAVKAAHGEADNWTKSLLRGAFAQASCAKCHDMGQLLSINADTDDASTLIAGWRLFRQYNCSGCHRLSASGRPDRIGPSLTFIGNKVNRAWLKNWLKGPGSYLPNAKMPRFDLSDEDIDCIADYLMSIPSPSRGVLQDVPTEHIRLSDDLTAIEGKNLVITLGCLGCHSVNGRGNNFAPGLSNIRSKVNVAWLVKFLRYPKEYQPKTSMPDMKIAEEDAQILSRYLMNLKNPPASTFSKGGVILSPSLAKRGEGRFSDNIDRGKKLVKTLGCTGCHEIDKLPSVYNAPDLDDVGDKRVDELAFGNKKNIRKTLKDWMHVKVTDPGSFATDRIVTIMPYYDFVEGQATALVTYLLSLRRDAVPPEYKMKGSTINKAVLDGRALIEKYNCRGCHIIENQGGTIGPDLSSEGKKSRPEWLFSFLKGPYKIRPLPMLKAGMPDFNLSDNEVNSIIEYLLSISGEPFPYVFEPKKEIGADDAWNGEKLYQEIFACSGCHTLNGHGGQVGPDHTDLASRLKREWIRQWLLNPQAINPDVSMPRFKFRDWEFEALTNYLMTLGKNRFVDIKNVN